MTLKGDFPNLAANGWARAVAGDIEAARFFYAYADQQLKHDGALNADLSVLRHSVGNASGLTRPVEPTEDKIVQFHIHDVVSQSGSGLNLKASVINGQKIEAGIKLIVNNFSVGFHKANISQELPHVLFMSTGRCGTISLYHLLKKSPSIIPYHAYWWQNALTARWETMCRIMDARVTLGAPVIQEWFSTRAAEWIGATEASKIMAGLNHMDTVFAPYFAALHKKSRFVYLRRDPVALFKSFYGKGQWKGNQLQQILYGLDPFQYRLVNYPIIQQIAWYIHFTEEFSQAMGRVLGGRFLEVQAEELFAGNKDTIYNMLQFIGANILSDVATEHFSKKINEKAHKKTGVLQSEIDEFSDARSRVRATGRL